MRRQLLKIRYEAFCTEVEKLLEVAGFATENQQPKIKGRAFLEACNKLATIHFPEDQEVSGTGPRGLIWSMYSAFDSKKDDLSGSFALAHVLKHIIKYRPQLDIRDKRRNISSEKDKLLSLINNSPFYDKKRDYTKTPELVFILMPFEEKWSNRIWNDHLQKYFAVAPSGKKLIARRADNMFGQGVMEDVYQGIMRAGLIVAECTGRNPNVLYELGIAHSIGKRTILLSQNENDIPFDLRRFRFCIYEDNSSGYPKLHSFINESLKEIYNNID